MFEVDSSKPKRSTGKRDVSGTLLPTLADLRQMLNNPHITNSEFCQRWKKAAKKARVEGNSTALRLFLGLLDRAPGRLSVEGEVLYNEYSGMLDLIMGAYDKARYHFGEQLHYAKLSSEQADLAGAYINLARVALYEYKLNEVESLLQQAEYWASSSGDAELITKTLNRQAELLCYRHLTHNSLEKGQLALEKARQYQLQIEEAYALNWLGVNYVYLLKLDQAEQVLLEATRLRQEAGDVLGRAEALSNLSRVYVKKGELNFARNCLEGSLAILQQLQHRPALAHALYYMGVVLLRMEQPAAALSWAMRAVEVRLELGEPRKIAETFSSLARIYAGLNQHKLALACHQKVLELHEAGDDTPIWIELLIAAGDYLLDLPDSSEERDKHWEKALESYQYAINVIEKNEELYYLAPTLGRMARALRKINGMSGLEKAAQCYRLQLRLLGDMENTPFEITDAISQRAEALSGIQIAASLLRRQPEELLVNTPAVTESGTFRFAPYIKEAVEVAAEDNSAKS